MKKTLRRRVLIRKYDYERKLLPQSHGLYDRVEFTPITQKSIEQDLIWSILKGQSIDTNEDFTNLGSYINLQRHNGLTYNPRYIDYSCYWDPFNGNAIMYSRADRPSSVLGWAVLEKDLVVGH
jgi:hypothetical protein